MILGKNPPQLYCMPHMDVIGVGLGGAPQAVVIHLGAFVVEYAHVSEWKDADRPFHSLTISSLGSKASLQEGKGDENAQNQHDYLVTGCLCSDARSELSFRLLPLSFIPSEHD